MKYKIFAGIIALAIICQGAQPLSSQKLTQLTLAKSQLDSTLSARENQARELEEKAKKARADSLTVYNAGMMEIDVLLKMLKHIDSSASANAAEQKVVLSKKNDAKSKSNQTQAEKSLKMQALSQQKLVLKKNNSLLTAAKPGYEKNIRDIDAKILLIEKSLQDTIIAFKESATESRKNLAVAEKDRKLHAQRKEKLQLNEKIKKEKERIAALGSSAEAKKAEAALPALIARQRQLADNIDIGLWEEDNARTKPAVLAAMVETPLAAAQKKVSGIEASLAKISADSGRVVSTMQNKLSELKMQKEQNVKLSAQADKDISEGNTKLRQLEADSLAADKSFTAAQQQIQQNIEKIDSEASRLLSAAQKIAQQKTQQTQALASARNSLAASQLASRKKIMSLGAEQKRAEADVSAIKNALIQNAAQIVTEESRLKRVAAAQEKARQDSINVALEKARQDSIAAEKEKIRQALLAAQREKARQDSIAAAIEKARVDSIKVVQLKARQDSIAAEKEKIRQAQLAALQEKARKDSIRVALAKARQDSIAAEKEKIRQALIAAQKEKARQDSIRVALAKARQDSIAAEKEKIRQAQIAAQIAAQKEKARQDSIRVAVAKARQDSIAAEKEKIRQAQIAAQIEKARQDSIRVALEKARQDSIVEARRLVAHRDSIIKAIELKKQEKIRADAEKARQDSLQMVKKSEEIMIQIYTLIEQKDKRKAETLFRENMELLKMYSVSDAYKMLKQAVEEGYGAR